MSLSSEPPKRPLHAIEVKLLFLQKQYRFINWISRLVFRAFKIIETFSNCVRFDCWCWIEFVTITFENYEKK